MKTRTFASVLGAAAFTLLIASPASAHVTVSPSTADKGSDVTLSFHVPNEEDSATTTAVELDIPTDHPIADVSIEPKAGWTYAIEKTHLATPAKSDDGDVTDAISKITWTAEAANAIKAGEFQEFNLSVGPLPDDESSVTFKALQTYSDGTVVRWIDLTTPGQDEPEHPAPVLTLTATASDTPAAKSTTGNVKKSDVDMARTLGIVGIVLGGVGLLAALGSFARKRQA